MIKITPELIEHAGRVIEMRTDQIFECGVFLEYFEDFSNDDKDGVIAHKLIDAIIRRGVDECKNKLEEMSKIHEIPDEFLMEFDPEATR